MNICIFVNMNGTDYTWIDNLKVGDEVITGGRIGRNIQKVTAVNKATIKVGDTLYNKKDGKERGMDSWNAWYIMEATEKNVAEVKLIRARAYLRKTLDYLDVDKLSMEEIERILTAIK